MPETKPRFHLTSPTGEDCEPFDPNGAIFWKGRYHLGFIIGFYDECSKHFWWGHVSSADLIEWKLHRPMLSPCPGDPDKGIYSGNAFVDKKGRVVIHYHGVDAGNCIAINDGDDELDSFLKSRANPVMKDPGWDPFGWLEDDVYYSISGSHPEEPGTVAWLYKSTDEDQAEWDLVGEFMSREMPDVEFDEDLSGPDLFELGERRVLLGISHKRGARYYLGRFEDEQFHPEEHHRMNWAGGICFALETLRDDRGRRIFWAWVVGSPSTMTLPRVLSMRDDGRIGIEPVEELDALRQNHRRLGPFSVEPGAQLDLGDVSGDCMELRVAVDPGQATQCGVKVRRSPDGEEETAILYDASKKVLRIDVAKSSLDPDALPETYVMLVDPDAENPRVTAQEAPFELAPGETLDLRVYLDRSILEVFANGRQCVTQRIFPTREDSLGVGLFSVGEAASFASVEAWDMAPIVVQ